MKLNQVLFLGLGLLALSAQPGGTLDTLEILNQVDAGMLRAEVQGLTAIESRATRTRGNQEATTLLFNRFQALGYTPEKQCFDTSSSGPVCNVIARKAAVSPTTDQVVVMAHFDSVGHPHAGADDNASGTAAVIEMARVLKSVSLRANVVFVATNGEENGLLGSKHFVSELVRAGQLATVKLAVVMDMIGVNTGRADIETYEAHRALGQGFIDAIPTYVQMPSRLIIPGWGSDHISFLSKGVPSFLIIDDTDVGTDCYHQACDLIDTIDFDYHRKMVQISLLATIRAAGL